MKNLAVVLLCLLVPACTTHSSMRQVADFGTQMARQGLWREAAFRWNQALTTDPTNAKLLNNLAVAAEVRGDYDRAAHLYKKAFTLDPDNRIIRKNYDKLKTFLNSQRSAD